MHELRTSEVGGSEYRLPVTGKSLRFVRSCVRARNLSCHFGGKIGRRVLICSLCVREVTPLGFLRDGVVVFGFEDRVICLASHLFVFRIDKAP